MPTRSGGHSNLRSEVEVAYGLYDEDEHRRELRAMRAVLTNFGIRPSEDGKGYVVWSDAHNIIDGVGLKTEDMIERDDLIAELDEMGFELSVSGLRLSRRDQPNVHCSFDATDFRLGITFEKGRLTCSFSPEGLGAPLWSRFEITRHYSRLRWSDHAMFALVQSAARLAYEGRDAKTVAAVFQSFGIPARSLDAERKAADAYLKRKWKREMSSQPESTDDPFFTQCDDCDAEDPHHPTPYLLRIGMTAEEAEEFVGSIGEGITGFTDAGLGTITGQVIGDLTHWDFRSEAEKVLDASLEALHRRGYIGYFEGGFSRKSKPDLRLSLAGNSCPSIGISSSYITIEGIEHPATNQHGAFFLSLYDHPGGRSNAYALIPLLAEHLDRSELPTELLNLFSYNFYTDSQLEGDEPFPWDAFDGGYIGDGLWIGLSGIEDRGR